MVSDERHIREMYGNREETKYMILNAMLRTLNSPFEKWRSDSNYVK
jgi:hypothetical protein